MGYTADTDMYEIATEYDGREVVIIKPNIQYQVALAGAIKKDLPEFNELDEILTNGPNTNGIWIESSSREKFLKILKEITECNYTINEDGFLVQEENEKTKRLIEEMRCGIQNLKTIHQNIIATNVSIKICVINFFILNFLYN